MTSTVPQDPREAGSPPPRVSQEDLYRVARGAERLLDQRPALALMAVGLGAIIAPFIFVVFRLASGAQLSSSEYQATVAAGVVLVLSGVALQAYTTHRGPEVVKESAELAKRIAELETVRGRDRVDPVG